MPTILPIGLALTALASLVAQETQARRPHAMPRQDRPGVATTETPKVVGASNPTRQVTPVRHRSPESQVSSSTTPTLRTRLAEGSGFASFLPPQRRRIRPNSEYWRKHDLMAMIRAHAQKGFIPASPFPDDANELSHYAMASTGWRVYGFIVPAGGTLRVDLKHGKPAWFRTLWSNQWGEYRPGMKVKIGDPAALYQNLESTVQAVYLLVDDPGLWSSEKDPFILKVQRSWDPKSLDTAGVTLAAGIWNMENTFLPAHR